MTEQNTTTIAEPEMSDDVAKMQAEIEEYAQKLAAGAADTRAAMAAFEAQFGKDASIVLRVGLTLQSLHMSSTMLGDTEDAQRAKNEMFDSTMEMLSQHFKLEEPVREAIADFTCITTNNLAELVGFRWEMVRRKPEDQEKV